MLPVNLRRIFLYQGKIRNMAPRFMWKRSYLACELKPLISQCWYPCRLPVDVCLEATLMHRGAVGSREASLPAPAPPSSSPWWAPPGAGRPSLTSDSRPTPSTTTSGETSLRIRGRYHQMCWLIGYIGTHLRMAGKEREGEMQPM